MAEKVGVYICSGCGIGEALDVDALCGVGTKDGKAAICKSHPFLCGEEGVKLVKDDIQNEGINGVVIAACSPRVKMDTFYFDPPVFTERVNIREHVIWCHPANDEDTQMMAEDYLRMGCAKTHKAEVPEPYTEEIDKTVLVVGGGITGMTAAIMLGLPWSSRRDLILELSACCVADRGATASSACAVPTAPSMLLRARASISRFAVFRGA